MITTFWFQERTEISQMRLRSGLILLVSKKSQHAFVVLPIIGGGGRCSLSNVNWNQKDTIKTVDLL